MNMGVYICSRYFPFLSLLPTPSSHPFIFPIPPFKFFIKNCICVFIFIYTICTHGYVYASGAHVYTHTHMQGHGHGHIKFVVLAGEQGRAPGLPLLGGTICCRFQATEQGLGGALHSQHQHLCGSPEKDGARHILPLHFNICPLSRTLRVGRSSTFFS